MRLECGPAHDIRRIDINLPANYNRIGVMVSGGIDSTILYYLILSLAKNTDYYVRPFAVKRKEGSVYHAKPCVEEVGRLFNRENDFPTFVGDNTLPELKQVESGLNDAYNYAKMQMMYVGVIFTRPEHLVGYDKLAVNDTQNLQFPFQYLEKSHVVDLYYRFGIEYLLAYTHSCDRNEHEHCWDCNGCNERTWAFEQLNKKDPKRT
jgi:hypothetical protein